MGDYDVLKAEIGSAVHPMIFCAANRLMRSDFSVGAEGGIRNNKTPIGDENIKPGRLLYLH